MSDDISATQLKYTLAPELKYQLSYMQNVTPSLSLGGMGTYHKKDAYIETSYAIVYNPDENILAAQWDKSVSENMTTRQLL